MENPYWLQLWDGDGSGEGVPSRSGWGYGCGNASGEGYFYAHGSGYACGYLSGE